MLYKRIIAKLDIKSEHVVKGIHMEGLRIVGNPSEFASKYSQQGADELIFIDTVASLYGRNHLKDIILEVSEKLYIPLTVGGGISSIEDIRSIINMGADKIAINSYAVRNKNFITEASTIFGSQAIVISVQAKKIDNEWIVFIENGREITNLKVLDWVQEVEKLGAGEILLTSIDKDGTKKGFDQTLYKQVCNLVNIPVIACGGAGTIEHIIDVFNSTQITGVALGSILHYNLIDIKSIKNGMLMNKILVRVDNDEA